MNQTAVVITIAVVALILVALFVMLVKQPRSGGGKATQAPTPAKAEPAPAEPKGVVSSGTAAVGDVAGQMIGLDINTDPNAPADDLTRIKGLGPKAAGQLKLVGITRFAQLAALDGAQCEALDEQMGPFRGRLARDRWVEQARYLARGDTTGFEAEFGKLG